MSAAPPQTLFGQLRALPPALRWGLLVTLLACAWAWQQGDEVTEPVATGGDAPTQVATAGLQSSLGAVPAAPLEPALADPFGPAPLPVATKPAPQAALMPAPPLPQPVAPAPPQSMVRVIGVLRDAQGQLNVYLGGGSGQDQLARIGLVLDDGFVVQGWNEQAVQLLHPGTGTTQSLPLPRSDGREAS